MDIIQDQQRRSTIDEDEKMKENRGQKLHEEIRQSQTDKRRIRRRMADAQGDDMEDSEEERRKMEVEVGPDLGTISSD